MENNMVEYLNKFLAGIHMGCTTFKDYLEKANNSALRDEIINIIECFKRHEEAITHRIEQLNGNAKDTLGIKGTIADIFEKVKLVTINNDSELCEQAIKAINMGIDNANKFISEHNDMEESLMSDIKGIVSDYDNILTHLKEISAKIVK